MKRKGILSFESEGFSGSAADKQPRRIPHDVPRKESDAGPTARSSTNPAVEATKRKSKKEFAWMDSEDEGDADGSDGGGSDDKASSDDEALVALPENIRDVKTFGEFLRITPALKRKVPSMPAGELTALCETASRLKYFDGDLFSEVFKQISTRIQVGEFDIPHLTAVATALVDLNACDVSVFRAAADHLNRRLAELSKDQRLHWIQLLTSSFHPDTEFFRHAALISAMKAPPPEDSNRPQARICYDWVGSGFCPRGTSCAFPHPKKEMGSGLGAGCR